MSNEILPQGPQQSASQPSPQSTMPSPMPTSPTSKTKKLLAGLAAVAILATSAFYFTRPEPATPLTTDAPPQFTLEFEGNKLGGLLADNISCRIPGYEFTQDRVNSFQAPALPSNQKYPLPAGVHLFHSDNEVSVQDIIRKIVPTEGNKVMFVIYNPLNNADKKFSLYPPIASPAVVSINDPANYKIPANNGIAIISCQATEIWEIKPETVPGSGLPANIASTRENWVLASASSGLDTSAYEITSVWPQSGEGFTFANSVDPNSELALSNYYMVWLKVKGPKSAVPPVVQPEQPDNPPQPPNEVVNVLNTATCSSTTFNRLGNPLREGQFTISPATLREEGWNWSWNFGDNQTGNQKAATVYHAYASAGTYNASVTIGKDGLERTVQCAPVNIAAVQAPQNIASCANLDISAKANGTVVPTNSLVRGTVYEISVNNFSNDPAARVNLRTSAAYGQFLVEPSGAPLTKANQNIVGFATKALNPGQKTYFVVYRDAPAGATTITGTTTGFASNCSDSLNIPAAQETPVVQASCNALNLTATRQDANADSFERGKIYEITGSVTPQAGNDSTRITLTAFGSYGKFLDSNSAFDLRKPASTPAFVTKTLTPGQKTYFLVYSDAPAQASGLSARTEGLSNTCIDSITIEEFQEPVSCEPMTTRVSSLNSIAGLETLRRGNVYNLSVGLTLRMSSDLALTINPSYGTFVSSQTADLIQQQIDISQISPSIENFNEVGTSLLRLPSTIRGNTGDLFYFYIYRDAPNSAIENLIGIETNGLDENCSKSLNLGAR